VTATDLEQAEVRPVVYLSGIHGELLDLLSLRKDMIVISCSGVNLGKSFYVRPDMDGLVASHDLIRVVADPAKIRAGYLFAYLDSRFGRNAVRRSTHGGSVRHIEPAALASLRVPRLTDDREAEINNLVFEASRLLANHVSRLDQATSTLEASCGLSDALLDGWEESPVHFGWSEDEISTQSLRALNYDPRAQAIRHRLTSGDHRLLADLCDPAYFRGKQVFKREDASSNEGVLLLGQRGAFRLRPEGRFLARESVERHGLRVPPGTVLIPSHGTLGPRELYCRAVVVTPGMANYAFSGDFFRCAPLSATIEPGYLYAFLRSRHAFRLLRSISSGAKQQELSVQRMAEFPVPRLPLDLERQIGLTVDLAIVEYDTAVQMLTRARIHVERSVGRAGEHESIS
jgi:type I restriction enzyme S subunit